ncbi:hypothetical protein CALVIDRAFT_564041 [Calocera viscosa TUFC12733]|uniref:Uncharacterized protein n=1 Tax=Calocera viscosa (strain TUFC12733) TaxID=1330018 RepID=A0A167LY05_CALVF|nr:hypothetical protein CALVIDRAFT_564041 [Calocera viscosa TUFC12733]
MGPPQPSGSTAPTSSRSTAEFPSVPISVKVLPQIDERCFTYCTQRSNARTFQSEPVCHTFCWRKVRNHERLMLDLAGKPGNVQLNITGSALTPNPEEDQALAERFHAEEARLRALALSMRASRRPAEKEDVAASIEAHVRDMKKEMAQRDAKLEVREAGMDAGEKRDKVTELRKMIRMTNERFYKYSASPRCAANEGRIWHDSRLVQFYPFAPPRTDSWSFLRGNYIYYARGPARATEQMDNMRHVGLGLGKEWVADGAWAVRDNGEKREKESRSVGLQELQAEASGILGGGKQPRDPNYAVLLSLENIPPTVYASLDRTLQRIYNPVASLLERYRESFASGQQRRTAGMLWTTAFDPEDGPIGTLKKLGEAFVKRRKEEEREREEREKEK